MAGPVASPGAVLMITGTILEVYPDAHVCDVQTESNQRLERVPILSLFQHREDWGGVIILPEKGDECVVWRDTEGNYRVFGFHSAAGATSGVTVDADGAEVPTGVGPAHGGNKPPMDPGDIYIGTRGGARAFWRRSGLIEISSTALCRVLFVPVDNLIQLLFQNLELRSPLGELTWTHEPLLVDGAPSATVAQDVRALLRINARRSMQEVGRYSVELRMGDVSSRTLDAEKESDHFLGAGLQSDGSVAGQARSTGDGLLSAVMYSHETNEAVAAVQIGADGDIVIRTARNLHVETAGSLYLRASKGLAVEVGNSLLRLLQDGAFLARIASKLTLEAPLVQVDAKTSIILKCGATSVALTPAGIVLSGPVQIGSGAAASPLVTAKEINALLAQPFIVTGAVMPAGVVTGTAQCTGVVFGANNALT